MTADPADRPPTFSDFECWYGRDVPPSHRCVAQAGFLSAEIEADGLRYVRLGDTELLRRLHVAVRDEHWGTVAPLMSVAESSFRARSFRVHFTAKYDDQVTGIGLNSEVDIEGRKDGSLHATFRGEATNKFLYNRIGWCILHPDTLSGTIINIRTPDSAVSVELPVNIGPQYMVNGFPAPLFPSFIELEMRVDEGPSLSFDFVGDLFEMEDQRNWSDASFKTYSTPLSLGFPHSAVAGQRFHQEVHVTPTLVNRKRRTARRRPEIEVGDPVGVLPEIGVGAAHLERPLMAHEIELLASCRFRHLRVDVRPESERWEPRLLLDIADARAIGAPIELAVHVPREAATLRAVGDVLLNEAFDLARVLAFDAIDGMSSVSATATVREQLGNVIGSAPVIGGSDLTFAELNRLRPVGDDLVDGVAWPIAATVHADDDVSVAETPVIHGTQVRSAREFVGERSLHVSPITFRPRRDARRSMSMSPDELSPAEDQRQRSLLGAGWTVASLKHIAEAGADTATYFETAGSSGLIESRPRSSRQEPNSSQGQRVFPVYHVLRDIGECSGGEIYKTVSSDPLMINALAVRIQTGLRMIIASLSSTHQDCLLSSVPAGEVVSRLLNARSYQDACLQPERFRAVSRTLHSDGKLKLALPPYAIARLDFLA